MEQRVEDALQRMTLPEKIAVMTCAEQVRRLV